MKKNINLEIGERVRQSRTATGLSREKLAELLGISTLFLGYIECGQRGMSINTLHNLCNILNESADYILFGKKLSSEEDMNIIYEAAVGLDPKYFPLAADSINQLKKLIALSKENE